MVLERKILSRNSMSASLGSIVFYIANYYNIICRGEAISCFDCIHAICLPLFLLNWMIISELGLVYTWFLWEGRG